MYFRLIFFAFGLLCSAGVFATGATEASLFLTSQSLIFYDKSRSQSVHVVNRGNRTGVFAIRWVDHTMTEEGRLFTWEEPAQSPFSLQPYIRYSPRRVTLKPGESQLIRIALKKPIDQVPVGEYFSHLNVVTLNKNVEESIRRYESSSASGKANKTSSIQIVARTGISIPVVWRHTDEKPGATVEVINLDKERSLLDLNVGRTGIVSTRGFIHVVHSRGGREERIMQPHPLVIYPNIKERRVQLTLGEVSLKAGELRVYYSDNKEHWDKPLGRSHVPL